MAQELQQAHEDLQATRDEMQTSQEELKSTNEELQSMNEELQSTNEELTTSKEEMQSMNEELQTVNHELQAKVDELSRTSNDMKNLLDSTDIATLFLDDALLVRRFTPQTTSIIKLIPSDIGRPITDIVTALDYPELAEDTQKVLKRLVFVEKQVSARDQRWFTVRIMPYRTQDNRIDGVVITFADITVAKKSGGGVAEGPVRSGKALHSSNGGTGQGPEEFEDRNQPTPTNQVELRGLWASSGS
jgi:two-component system, chemotaxis family, CheB/CheR fusion protein